jgi:hypothetical protein
MRTSYTQQTVVGRRALINGADVFGDPEQPPPPGPPPYPGEPGEPTIPDEPPPKPIA